MVFSLLYNALLFLTAPLLVLVFVYKAIVHGKTRRGLAQQLGFYARDELTRCLTGSPRLWIHAVSVGETMAAAGLVKALREELPEAALVVSTTTDTGQETARKQLTAADALIYFPLDFSPCVRSSVQILRPDVFVMIETELWPNVLHRLKQTGAATLLANGRMSDRNVRTWRFLRPFLRWLYDQVDVFAMRSDYDADRLLEQGIPPPRVFVTGEMKMDHPLEKLPPEDRAALREELGVSADEQLVVAGSTHPGEEEKVLEAFWRLRMEHPKTRLLLAPRHLERVDEVASLIESQGFRPLRRTELTHPGETAPAASGEDAVLLLDTMGELARLYGACDLAYLGGSLVARGGHNVLEPAIQGRPVLFGPHMQNFRSLADLLQTHGVAWEVRDPADLARRAGELLGNPEELRRVEERAAAAIEQNRGATRRNAQLIAKLAAGWRP